jgi:hypothetical protein
MKETNMLTTKMDLLIKCLEERTNEKEAMKNTVQALVLHMTCEVCGDVGHSGNDCPETREEVAFINNGFHQ